MAWATLGRWRGIKKREIGARNLMKLNIVERFYDVNEKRLQMNIINNETYHMHERLFMDENFHIYVIIMGFNVITWVGKKINVIFNTNELYHA